MACETVFQFSLGLIGEFGGFILIMIGLIAIILLGYYENGIKNLFTLSGGLFFILISMALVRYIVEYKSFNDAVKGGNAQTVCGKVEVLKREPEHGRPPGDKIRIKDKQFEIQGVFGSSAYDKTIRNGGVLDDGKKAKLTYFKGHILKIELCNDGCSN